MTIRKRLRREAHNVSNTPKGNSPQAIRLEDLGLNDSVRQMVPKQILFDRYYLNRILGRGGMGIVWQAHDFLLERDVALKFLPDTVTFNPDALEDLKLETRRSLQLTHPHIIRIYDLVQDKTWACISMEYVEGSNLSSVQDAQPNQCFEVPAIKTWVQQLLEGLEYAHTRAKVIHRDLKPGNLMISNDGELKIADFGISRTLVDSDGQVTSPGDASGTLVYMSPQQARGQIPTVTDDIYSLGATLYDLLSGRPPFYSGDIASQVQRVSPPSITERRVELGYGRPPVDPVWEEIIAACLAKDPANRPPSIAEVRSLLFSGSDRPATPRAPSPTIQSAAKKPADASMPGQETAGQVGRHFYLTIVNIAIVASICLIIGLGLVVFIGLNYFVGPLSISNFLSAPESAGGTVYSILLTILDPFLLAITVYYLKLKEVPILVSLPIILVAYFVIPPWYVLALIILWGMAILIFDRVATKSLDVRESVVDRLATKLLEEMIQTGGYNRAHARSPTGLMVDGNCTLRYPNLFIGDSPFDLTDATIHPKHPHILVLSHDVQICLYQGPTDSPAG